MSSQTIETIQSAERVLKEYHDLRRKKKQCEERMKALKSGLQNFCNDNPKTLNNGKIALESGDLGYENQTEVTVPDDLDWQTLMDIAPTAVKPGISITGLKLSMKIPSLRDRIQRMGIKVGESKVFKIG